jgi:hypothetical protein
MNTSASLVMASRTLTRKSSPGPQAGRITPYRDSSSLQRTLQHVDFAGVPPTYEMKACPGEGEPSGMPPTSARTGLLWKLLLRTLPEPTCTPAEPTNGAPDPPSPRGSAGDAECRCKSPPPAWTSRPSVAPSSTCLWSPWLSATLQYQANRSGCTIHLSARTDNLRVRNHQCLSDRWAFLFGDLRSSHGATTNEPHHSL